MSHFEISKKKDCLENVNSTFHPVSTGIVVFLPDTHRVILDKYSDNKEFKANRMDHIRNDVPHIIMAHNYKSFSLDMVGGSVEPGETPVDAVNREWSEEVMGYNGYLLHGKSVFTKEHFKCKTRRRCYGSYMDVYIFVRIIQDRSIYKEIVKDMNRCNEDIITPGSVRTSIDTMGGISVPIYMEPLNSSSIFKTIGFPNILNNMNSLHRYTMIVFLLMEIDLGKENCILTNSGKDMLISSGCMKNIPDVLLPDYICNGEF